MKKLIKIIGALLIVLVIAVLGVVFTFDANNYKQDIVTQVEQQTGRKFSIGGDIQLTVYPWIGLKAERVSLGNAKGFSKYPLAKMKLLEVKVQLLPLFMKELRVDKVRFHGLAASLEVNESGRNNWSDLSRPSPDSKPGNATRPTAATDGNGLAGLFVNGIEMVDSVVSWSDAQTGTKAKILNLSLTTSAIEFDELVVIDVSAGVVSSKPDIKAKIAMKGGVKFNQALNIFDTEDFQLSVITHLKELTPKPIVLKLKTNSHFDLQQGTAHGDIQISSVGAAINSNFNITNLNSKPVINGTLSSNAMNGRALAKKLQIELPVMSGPRSLTKISINSSIQATPNSLRLDKLKLTVDGSLLSGSVYVADMTLPKVRYSLDLQPVVLDSYLPPPPPELSNTDKVNLAILGNKKKPDVKIPLPLDLLRKMDVEGELNIEKLTFKNIPITKIKLPVKAANGVLIMHPVSMSVFDGAVRAKLGLDVRTLPSYIVDISGSRLKAGSVIDPVLTGIMGNQKVTMQGSAKVDIKLTASGESLLALKKSASGKIQMDTDKVALNGVDVEHYVHNAVADYVKAKNIPFLEGFRGEYLPVQKTAFDRFHASFIAAQGKLTNNDLVMESKKANVTGAGWIDMVGESVDYRPMLDIKVENPVSKTDKLKDMPMGFHIHGPFSKLKYEVDKKQYYGSVENLFKKEARAKIKQKVDSVKQEEKEKIKQKVKDKLKGLFNR